MSKIQIVVDFLSALCKGNSSDSLQKFYHPKAVQTEFPNLLTKERVDRDTDQLKIAAERGMRVLTSQKYEIVKSYDCGNVVIIEAIWTGILAIPLGKKNVGDAMTAHFAQFYEFEGDLILRQRNYDCFENFL